MPEMTPCKIHPLLVNPVVFTALIAIGFGWGFSMGMVFARLIQTWRESWRRKT